MTTNHSCLPVEVRTAVYRRAVAQGYLSACEHYGLNISASLDCVAAWPRLKQRCIKEAA